MLSGVSCQALRDLVSWVEDGIAPPRNTSYRFTNEGGIVLPESAEARGGVQPVVTASANGGIRADVKVGEPVTLVGTAHQPPGTGTFTYARWDLEGTVDLRAMLAMPVALPGPMHEHPLNGDNDSVTVETTYAYTKPGTYFPSFQVGAHRDGIKGAGLPAENFATVRVVVT
jgi:hypothetical protein